MTLYLNTLKLKENCIETTNLYVSKEERVKGRIVDTFSKQYTLSKTIRATIGGKIKGIATCEGRINYSPDSGRWVRFVIHSACMSEQDESQIKIDGGSVSGNDTTQARVTHRLSGKGFSGSVYITANYSGSISIA